ncbi:unnamed protein product [Pipistrellus nathusii]|uniref:Uncharacterized protein n=1 Tax=Pipistrellus nathusii TaxID=59473 RepID=A0ABN9Z1U4_PIPNA
MCSCFPCLADDCQARVLRCSPYARTTTPKVPCDLRVRRRLGDGGGTSLTDSAVEVGALPAGGSGNSLGGRHRQAGGRVLGTGLRQSSRVCEGVGGPRRRQSAETK